MNCLRVPLHCLYYFQVKWIWTGNNRTSCVCEYGHVWHHIALSHLKTITKEAFQISEVQQSFLLIDN